MAVRSAIIENWNPPVSLRLEPLVVLTDERLYEFCRLNRDLRIERTAEGDIIILAPEAGSSGRGSSKLNALFHQWSERDGTGQVFGSSTGFNLPNGATRSPDVAWVRSRLFVHDGAQSRSSTPPTPPASPGRTYALLVGISRMRLRDASDEWLAGREHDLAVEQAVDLPRDTVGGRQGSGGGR